MAHFLKRAFKIRCHDLLTKAIQLNVEIINRDTQEDRLRNNKSQPIIRKISLPRFLGKFDGNPEQCDHVLLCKVAKLFAKVAL